MKISISSGCFHLIHLAKDFIINQNFKENEKIGFFGQLIQCIKPKLFVPAIVVLLKESLHTLLFENLINDYLKNAIRYIHEGFSALIQNDDELFSEYLKIINS